jgi:hypothetical protein
MDNTLTSAKESCTYHLHENGIHEMVLMEPTRQGVDQLVDHLDRLYSMTPPDQLLREVIYFCGNLPPISYAMQRARQHVAMHPKLPRIRAAILYDNSLFISMFKPLANLLFSRVNNLNFRYYTSSEYTKAIEWLLQGQ